MLTWPYILAMTAGGLVLLWLAFVRWSRTAPSGEPVIGFLWLVDRIYCRFMHRMTVSGRKHVPATNAPGGLVVVSNHSGPIDPMVIQAACRFQIRWMMATDMMIPALEWLWKHHPVIAVSRDGRDSGPVREAIRRVKAGEVVGVFPEGAIVRPRHELRPFHEGVGLIISRTRAPVLLVWITGTPESPRMGEALTTRSRTRVVFLDLVEFDEGTKPATITRTLRKRLKEATGWPINDEPLIPPARPVRNGDPFAVA